MANTRPPFFKAAGEKRVEQADSSSAYLLKKRIEEFGPSEDTIKLKRLFQIIVDSVYSDLFPQLKLNKTNILLHCSERGNFGDIASTLFCAELIKKRRPECDINILFELMTLQQNVVNNVFQPTTFKVDFTSNDYITKEQIFSEKLKAATCVLGISVGIGTALLYKSQHRNLWEYGYYWHPDTKDETLSMGLNVSEEGIMVPTIQPKKLSEIKTPWVIQALSGANKIYHMHRRNWYLQILSLYQVAALEDSQQSSFAIVLPLVYSLKNYIDWGMLDIDYLKSKGIKLINRHTPEGIETIQLQEPGKEMAILSGAIPKPDMEIIQQYSEDFFGCGGDNTISECIALEKIPYYDGSEQKSWFFDSMIDLAKELKLNQLTTFFELLRQLISEVREIYATNTPKKRGFYSADPSFDLTDSNSVPRMSAKAIDVKLKTLTEAMSSLTANPEVVNEARQFCQFIKINRNVEPRLIASIDRGLILGNYPELIETEKAMWEQFKAGKITVAELGEAFTSAVASRQSAPQKHI